MNSPLGTAKGEIFRRHDWNRLLTGSLESVSPGSLVEILVPCTGTIYNYEFVDLKGHGGHPQMPFLCPESGTWIL